MDYQHYSALEFALDEHFQKWVLSSDEEVTHFWQTWLELHPEKESEVAEARKLLLIHNFKEQEWPVERQSALQQRIANSFEQQPNTQTEKALQPKVLKLISFAAAALVLLVSGVVAFFFLQSSKAAVYTTGFGEVRDLRLPDGSAVSLNANSSLHFSTGWEQKEHREVWLQGEAFFEVTPLQGKVGFTVHVDEVDVEVVGTAFNINNRSGKVEVTLDKGVVDLKLTDGERMRMQPGEMVAYQVAQKKLSKKAVTPEKVTAWRKHQIILEDKPLSELAEMIKNYYGVSIRFADPALSKKRFNVTLPSDNLEVVLESLELMLNVQSKRKDHVIILK